MSLQAANYQSTLLSGSMNLSPFNADNYRTGNTYHEILCLSDGSITIYPLKGDSFTWNATSGLKLNVLLSSTTVNSGNFLAFKAKTERNPFYQDTTNGEITSPAPPPPVPSNLWYTSYSPGGFGETLDAGAYGSTYILTPTELATFMQTNVMENSGGFESVSGSFNLWFLSDSEPLGWTIGGVPLLFTDAGAVSLLDCRTTGVFTFNGIYQNSEDWLLWQINTIAGNSFINPVKYYNDPTLPDSLESFVVRTFGTNATSLLEVTATTVKLTIYNTYNTPTNLESLDPEATQQFDAFGACP